MLIFVPIGKPPLATVKPVTALNFFGIVFLVDDLDEYASVLNDSTDISKIPRDTSKYIALYSFADAASVYIYVAMVKPSMVTFASLLPSRLGVIDFHDGIDVTSLYAITNNFLNA